MDAKPVFKFIVVGGGVAGLTLANMLERFGHDYILLESYAEVAPQSGASIGMFPNGLRILDQLGLYEPVLNLFDSAALYKKFYVRGDDGKLLAEIDELNEHFTRRHSYGMLFFDRQKLLEILYSNLKHKDRVLTSKRVLSADHTENGLSVTCADGTSHTGSILVGADGIHSIVRRIKNELGHKLYPTIFPNTAEEEENKITCEYNCSFGIAENVPGWTPGEQHLVIGRGAVIGGPNGRVYWLLCEQLPEIKYGKDIPRYTKEDSHAFAERHRHDPVTNTLKFGQIYDARLMTVLTPLQEIVFDRWHLGRIITIGDSAHKSLPIGGQGANGTIESCASLLNALHRRSKGDLSSLSGEEIELALKDTQEAREGRARDIGTLSNQAQAMHANEMPWYIRRLINQVVLPNLSDELLLNPFASYFYGDTTLDGLAVPRRKRAVPFPDERLTQPWTGWFSENLDRVTIWIMVALLILSTSWGRLPLVLAMRGVCHIFGRTPSTEERAGLPSENTRRALGFYCSFQPVAPLLAYTVEAHRIGHKGTLIRLTTLLLIGFNFFGISHVAPFIAILNIVFRFPVVAGRAVGKEFSQALAFALILVSSFLTLRLSGSVSPVFWNWLWNFLPPMFWITTHITERLLVLRQGGRDHIMRQAPERKYDRYKGVDVPALKLAYICAFLVHSAVHISTVCQLSTRDLPSIWQLLRQGTNTRHTSLFQWGLAFSSFITFSIHAIWDMRAKQYVSTGEAVRVTVAAILGQALVGTGATWVALWYWRETKIEIVINLMRSPVPKTRAYRDFY